jgi:hypothetical protein
MTSGTDWTTPPPEQIPPYCRTCRRALTRRVSPGGAVDLIHAGEQRGEAVDHKAQPVPLTEIADPIIECDFCSAPDAVWIYVCADQQTDTRIVTSRTVDQCDYQRRHHAARTRNVTTTAGPAQRWGQRWSACERCAALIEHRDLMGLIARVTDAMPAKLTRGKKLVQVRGHLHDTYTTVLATRRPGRGRITPGHPLGVWDPPGKDPHQTRASTSTEGSARRPAAK